MQNNIDLLKQRCTRLLMCFAILIAGLLTTACSGGISGTGDGRPPIVVDNSTTLVVDADSSNLNSGTGDEPADVGETPTANGDEAPLVQPFTVDIPIPSALLELNSLNENISAAQATTAQLITLQQQLATTLNSIETSQGVAEENINDAFDTTIRFVVNGTDTIVAQATSSALSYIFSNNEERAFQILQRDNGNTIRYLDRNSNALLQATFILLPGGITVIEADMNNNGMQTYLQIRSGDVSTTVFSQHPTDTSIARQRELIDSSGNITILQNCTSATQDCESDDSWSPANVGTGIQFESALTAIENSLALSDADNINAQLVALPVSTNEAVLAQSTADQPTQEQIRCGIQRVSDVLRTFCVLPVPFDTNSVYSETLDGGEIFYQLIDQTN